MRQPKNRLPESVIVIMDNKTKLICLYQNLHIFNLIFGILGICLITLKLFHFNVSIGFSDYICTFIMPISIIYNFVGIFKTKSNDFEININSKNYHIRTLYSVFVSFPFFYTETIIILSFELIKNNFGMPATYCLFVLMTYYFIFFLIMILRINLFSYDFYNEENEEE